MKNVLIVSADENTRTVLSQIIRKQESNLRIFQTNNIAKACEVVMHHDVELMLVEEGVNRKKSSDIEGLKFVEMVRKIEQYAFVPIIIISSSVEMELYMYRQLHCYGILDISFSVESAAELIKDALRYRMRKKHKEYLCMKDGGILYPIRVDEIVYIEHKYRRMYIHTTSKEVVIPYRTCKETMEELRDCPFELCARGILVNLNYIAALDVSNRYVVLMENYGKLEWGRTYIKSLKLAFGRQINRNT